MVHVCVWCHGFGGLLARAFENRAGNKIFHHAALGLLQHEEAFPPPPPHTSPPPMPHTTHRAARRSRGRSCSWNPRPHHQNNHAARLPSSPRRFLPRQQQHAGLFPTCPHHHHNQDHCPRTHARARHARDPGRPSRVRLFPVPFCVHPSIPSTPQQRKISTYLPTPPTTVVSSRRSWPARSKSTTPRSRPASPPRWRGRTRPTACRPWRACPTSRTWTRKG